MALNPEDPSDKGTDKKPTVLSRQDTFKYLEELTNGSPQVKVDAARALKSLAFNANAEYKDGLLRGGVPRLLMVMVTERESIAALEQATSCMYSLAREHLESKQALVKAGALRALAELLAHDSKQCQLNSCATLYAISCAGRDTCKTLAGYKPLPRLMKLVNPATPRTPQDDQLQLFAALLIVNLLHVRGITSKRDREVLNTSLLRAYDDATESQVRETIGVGLKRIATMNSATNRALHKVSKRLSKAIGSAGDKGGGDTAAAAARESSASGRMEGYGSGPVSRESAPAPASSKRLSSLGSLGSSMRGFGKSKGSGYQGSDSAAWED